jgi:ABC-type Mn2+/Zn2+ transport system permease subunit
MLATIWHSLAEPWRSGILRHAGLEAILIGVACGPLGCWVVFFRLAYSAESLAHSLFPGLVLAALAGAPLLLGGAGGALVAALAIALAARVRGTGAENAVAVVITALFGLGVLLALSPSSPPGLQNLLFGDILGASNVDLALAAGLAALVVVALRVLHWRLLTAGFDPGSAGALGASPLVAEIAVLVLLAAAILVAVQGMGNLLVVAVLVAPAATARMLTRRMGAMMALAGAIAAACGIGGLYASYYANVAAGAAMALAMVATYVLVALGVAAARKTAASRGAGSAVPAAA